MASATFLTACPASRSRVFQGILCRRKRRGVRYMSAGADCREEERRPDGPIFPGPMPSITTKPALEHFECLDAMSHVFVSYKRGDESRVARLVHALEQSGISVWWDRELSGGDNWRAKIHAALDGATCVVVVWTNASVSPLGGGFVLDEAARASARGCLIPVLMDEVAPPLGFGEVQAINLIRWRGSKRDPFFKDLLAAVEAKMAGRPVPPAQGPMRQFLRRVTYGGIASSLALVAGAFQTNSFKLQDKLCSLSWAQPGLSDACGSMGIGNTPTKAERLAWRALVVGDCSALRFHIRSFPAGAYRSRAEALVLARTVRQEESIVPSEQRIDLFVGLDSTPVDSERAAREAAMKRGMDDAAVQCRRLTATVGALFEYRDAQVDAVHWNCLRMNGGWMCGFRGQAICIVGERRRLEVETCDEEKR